MLKSVIFVSLGLLTGVLVGGCPMQGSPTDVTTPIGSPDITVNPNVSVTVEQQDGDTNATTGNQDQATSNEATSDSSMGGTQNRAPVAEEQSITVAFNTPQTIVLVATDPDGGPQALTYSIVDLPSHGALSGSASALTYTPNTGYSGPDSLTFKANDGAADSNAATVAITIQASGSSSAVQWRVEDGGNGHWYEVVYEPSGITWAQAKAAAEQAGGYLASITSSEENAFVYALVDDVKFWVPIGNPDTYWGPWLGGHRDVANQHWYWVSGESWSYSPWDNYMDNTADQAVHFHGTHNPQPKWNDLTDSCTVKGYVVEWDT